MYTERNTALFEALAHEAADALPVERLEARGSCRVLVVDDDPLVRSRLAALLHAAHYQVEVAGTGEEALRVLNATYCHILLTDWQMPDMDGLTLCRYVRRKTNERYVYVVMLTIRDTEHDLLKGLAAGADDYVVKGATSDEILARLAVGRRITQREYSLRTGNPENRSLSYTDSVTGAYNLAYLAQHLPRELARSVRYGHALAVLSCNVDGFKRFSDRFGQEAADEQLRSFVTGAEGSIRNADWLARTAGDAFMIVLPETTAAGAYCAAQKLRQLFALHPLSTPAEPIGFTVNIEVTAVAAKQDADSTARIESLLRSANCAAYANRQLGPAQADADSMGCTNGSNVLTPQNSGLN
jgi:two-component system, cell cycle response regulator